MSDVLDLTTPKGAERALLGSCLVTAEAIDDATSTISGGDFMDARHEIIFDAAVRLQQRGEHADPITVGDELGADLKGVGGIAYLFELVQSVPTAANAGYYADVVRKASLHRRVVQAGHRLAGLEEGGDPLDVVNAARQELDLLVTGDDVTTHTDDVYAAMESLENLTPFLPTPWADLTAAIGGWRPGCLYYVGARPGVGKSIVGVQAALDVARRGKVAHIASLEMSKVELYQRMLSAVGSVDQDRMQRRMLSSHDWSRLSEAGAHIANLPLSVDDRGTQRVVDIRAAARAIARTRDLGLIVVDYMQLMRSGGRVENRQQEVAGFSRELKLLAKELQVPVIALSQLNRASEHRHNRVPDMADMRESGALEQDGDGVLLLHRDPDEEPDVLKILVAKNRHGAADRAVSLRWEGAFSRATDPPAGWRPQPAVQQYPSAPPTYLKD